MPSPKYFPTFRFKKRHCQAQADAQLAKLNEFFEKKAAQLKEACDTRVEDRNCLFVLFLQIRYTHAGHCDGIQCKIAEK